jgi:hypothetical protein
MKKTLVAFFAIATIAVSSVAVAPPAKAGDGVGAGIAAGLIGGAIVGGAIAASRPYPYGGPVYVDAPPPGCYWHRDRFWDGYGWRFRSYQVCN